MARNISSYSAVHGPPLSQSQESHSKQIQIQADWPQDAEGLKTVPNPPLAPSCNQHRKIHPTQRHRGIIPSTLKGRVHVPMQVYSKHLSNCLPSQQSWNRRNYSWYKGHHLKILLFESETLGGQRAKQLAPLTIADILRKDI